MFNKQQLIPHTNIYIRKWTIHIVSNKDTLCAHTNTTKMFAQEFVCHLKVAKTEIVKLSEEKEDYQSYLNMKQMRIDELGQQLKSMKTQYSKMKQEVSTNV